MHYFAFSKAKVVHISKIHSLIVRILAVPFHRQKDSHCHQSKEKEFFDLSRYDRTYYSFQTRVCIPLSLQDNSNCTTKESSGGGIRKFAPELMVEELLIMFVLIV